MRNFNSLLLAAALTTAGTAYADGGGNITQLPAECYGNSISNNGKYVVGVNSSHSNEGINMSAFIYNTETKEINWLLRNDPDDVFAGGQFTGVNNSGTIIGTTKDPNTINKFGDGFDHLEGYANIATIFIDGKAIRLDYGTHQPSEFTQIPDGSFGRAISDDNKTAVGYVSIGNDGRHYPTAWRLGDDGSWKSEQLSLPKGAIGGEALGITPDGKIISGNVWKTGGLRRPCYWVDGEFFEIERDPDDWRAVWGGMSPDGRYISYSCDHTFYIYDCQEKTFRELSKKQDNYSINTLFAPLDNDGNMAGSYTVSGDRMTFYYSYEEDKSYDFDKYLEVVAPDIDLSLGLEKSQPKFFTEDGNTILGNFGNSGCYIISIEDATGIIADAPARPDVWSFGLHEITVTWPDYEPSYDGYTLSSYNIYKGDNKVASVDASAEHSYTFKDVPSGYPTYTMTVTLKDAKGGEIESQKSLERNIGLPDSYELPLYEDFEGSYYGTYWTENIEKGETISQGWGYLRYQGFRNSYATGCGTIEHYEHSSALESRPLDATKCDKVSLNFLSMFVFVNSKDWDLTKDGFSVEVTTDFGKTWQEVKYYPCNEHSFSWKMYDIDLSDYVAGKIFRVRLRTHGPGVALFKDYFDNLKITGTPEREAPKAMTHFAQENGNLELMWHSTLDTYQLNYMEGYPFLKALGDEGREIIGANSFTPEDLKPYIGKYITSVSTLVNNRDGLDNVAKAKAVIYIDDMITVEQEIRNVVPNRENRVILDKPIYIDGNHEIKVGILYYDYDAMDWPLVYQNTSHYKYKKSDVYSDDGGNTWKYLTDFYAGTDTPEDGHACWYISAGITDEAALGNDVPVLDDPDIICYNIYKNGEVMNKFIIDPAAVHYTAENADLNASYTVRAFYMNGDISKMSDAYVPALNSLKTLKGDNGFDYNRQNGFIMADGALALYSLEGLCVGQGCNYINVSDITHGIYILAIEKNGVRTSHKIRIY